ncbi:MAG: hypothetical protein GX567_01490 [Clostridia bacterium]|nr:hypothetical protein [Clostridia bacterium]
MSKETEDTRINHKMKTMVQNMYTRIFFPAFLSTSGLAIAGMADAVVLGRTIGEEGLAAITFTWPVFMVINTIAASIGIGGSIQYSKLLAKGHAKKALALFNACMILAGIAALIMMFLGTVFMEQVLFLLGAAKAPEVICQLTQAYIRLIFLTSPLLIFKYMLYFFVNADDGQIYAALSYGVGTFLDVFLSIVFVLFWGMGVEGAAYATILAAFASDLIFLVKLFRKNSILRFNKLKPDLKAGLKSVRIGLSSATQYIYSLITIIIVNQLLVEFCTQTEIAVYDVLINISYVLLALPEAVNTALHPIISTFYAEHSIREIKSVYRFSLRILFAISILILPFHYLFADQIGIFFGLAPGIGQTALRCLVLSMPFAYLSIAKGGYYQATGNEIKTAKIYVLRTLAFYIIILYICIQILPDHIWVFFIMAEALTLLIWYGKNLIKRENWYLCEEETKTLEILIENNDGSLAEYMHQIEAFCEQYGATVKQKYYITLIFEEVVSQIIQYAFAENANNYIYVKLIYSEKQQDETFIISVRDNCKAYNPFAVDARKLLSQEDEAIDHLGIYLVQEKAKRFFYRRYQGFNTLRITV